MLTEAPKLLGTDARKMSKSYGNTINLAESEDKLRAITQTMFTDPTRIKMSDPGHPETCNVCNYWTVFAPERAERVWEECRTSTRGCVQNKKELAEVLVKLTEPYRMTRAGKKGSVDIEAILQDGARRARMVAQQTMHEVRRVIGIGAA